MSVSENDLFFALLRVNAAQILRYSGIAGARPSVLDAFTDIIARYLLLLGSTTRQITELSGRTHSELIDARSALEHVGFLIPQLSYHHHTANYGSSQGHNDPDNDTRAIDAFITWAKSAEVEELRRVAGCQDVGIKSEIGTVNGGNGVEEDGLMGEEGKRKKQMDWMAMMKTRDGRGDDGERFRGTTLGAEGEMKKVVIEGGDAVKWKF